MIGCADWGQKAWVQVLPLSLISSINLGKLFSHFVLQFSQMEYGNDDVGKGREREEERKEGGLHELNKGFRIENA